jgi:hypothetical protein
MMRRKNKKDENKKRNIGKNGEYNIEKGLIIRFLSTLSISNYIWRDSQ